MQEEVQQKTVALSFSALKLSGSVLKKAMLMYLNFREKNKIPKYHKVSLERLMGKDAGAASIEIADGNIKDFSRIAKKFNVEFAVKKDKTRDPPKYLVFFKGRDTDVIAQAFKEYVHFNEKAKNRISVRDKLQKFKQIIMNAKNKERTREKQKDKGMER